MMIRAPLWAAETCTHAPQGVTVERGRGISRDIRAARLRGALREGLVRVVSSRGCVGPWKNKCLQTCVVEMMRREQKAWLVPWLKKACTNHIMSGRVGCQQALRNFELMEHVLAASHMFSRFGYVGSEPTLVNTGVFLSCDGRCCPCPPFFSCSVDPFSCIVPCCLLSLV